MPKYKLILENDGVEYSLESKLPKGDEYYYRCMECRAILPSNPIEPVRCACRNIVLDPEMFKLRIDNYKKFNVLKHMGS